MRKERVWLVSVSDSRRLVRMPAIADGGVVGLAVWDRGGASIRYVSTELAERRPSWGYTYVCTKTKGTLESHGTHGSFH